VPLSITDSNSSFDNRNPQAGPSSGLSQVTAKIGFLCVTCSTMAVEIRVEI